MHDLCRMYVHCLLFFIKLSYVSNVPTHRHMTNSWESVYIAAIIHCTYAVMRAVNRREMHMLSALLFAVLTAALGQPALQNASALPFPVGDPRNCETAVSGQDFFRMEVLPGLGWDNLRNLDQSIVLAFNYSTCKTTNDRKYLIPDDSFVIPLQRSKVDTYSELVSHALNYTSMTSNSINAGVSVYSRMATYLAELLVRDFRGMRCGWSQS